MPRKSKQWEKCMIAAHTASQSHKQRAACKRVEMDNEQLKSKIAEMEVEQKHLFAALKETGIKLAHCQNELKREKEKNSLTVSLLNEVKEEISECT
uniref:Uncharacterized protein n=1 Tax=Caenorhabditis japonica TaxID=281687 RepID=A0A8R1EUI2_CAEJA